MECALQSFASKTIPIRSTAMKETLERSNLGLLKVGDRVNIERSMIMNGRLDGHIRTRSR